MNAMLILVQAVAQNIALLCCALYTGAAVYVCLVEHPAMTEGGKKLADAFVVVAHPRTTIFHAAFGIVGALAGMLAGLASGRLAWLNGARLPSQASRRSFFSSRTPGCRENRKIGRAAGVVQWQNISFPS